VRWGCRARPPPEVTRGVAERGAPHPRGRAGLGGGAGARGLAGEAGGRAGSRAPGVGQGGGEGG
jgi:hypothetical protein